MQRLKSIVGGRQVLHDSWFSILDNGVLSVFGLFYVVFLARVLQKDEYGVVVLFDVIRNIATLFPVAVGQAVVKFLAEKNQNHHVILSSGIALQSIYVLACSILLVISRSAIAQVLNAPRLGALLVWLPLLLIVHIIHLSGSRFFWGRGDLQKVFLLDLVFVLVFVLLITTAFATNNLNGALTVVKSMIVARAASALVAGALLSKRVELIRPDFSWVLCLWKYARSAFLNSLGVLGYSSSDKLMVGAFLSPNDVATYNAGAVVFNLFMLLNETMNMLVLPKASESSVRARDTRNTVYRRLYVRASGSFLLLSFPIALALVVMPTYLAETLYGGRFPEVPHLFALFAIWGLVLPLSRTAASILNGSGHPQANARVTWVMAVLSLALNSILIPQMGLHGAAASTLLVAVSTAMCYWVIMGRYFGLRLSDIALLSRCFPGTCPGSDKGSQTIKQDRDG